MSASGAAMARPAATLAQARPWRRAALWLGFLAPFFYATYGTANWLASLRSGVPSIVFDWEHTIPFLGWTILPYWAINAFYGLSLFVCRTKDELDTHGRRLLTAQIVAVTCFILFPLRFTFVQPETHGVVGFLFATLTSFDKPFNQAPSLHVALLVILWVFYACHLPRWARSFLHPLFVLIGASVLTTYQHHFIDIPTGALLGFLCLWLWPDASASPLATFRVVGDGRRLALAARYAAGAFATSALALWIGGGALWLLWPTFSLALVAANYAFFGPAGFQKRPDGRMSLAARVLLAPYLAGAWINSRAWTRHDSASVIVGDGVALGRMPGRREAMRFATVVDMSAELPRRDRHAAWQAFPMLDLVPPDPRLLREAAAAIEEARIKGPVLVCCALGYSRSASALATWLVLHQHSKDVSDAIEQIRRARPRIVLGDSAARAIATAIG
jgi:membrane-associated phospholipid phosphatase